MNGGHDRATGDSPPPPRSALARVALGPSTHARHAARGDPWLLRDDDGHGLDLDLDDPGQRDFGDYELLERIGRGGMGVVYRAHQHSLDREVAIKLLVDGAWASPDFIDALEREARSAARLQHPGIVTVYDIGEHGDLVYYAMALVDGESLAQRIAREGPLPLRAAAACLRTVAEAVDYAHRLGVLHLDLKPANVILGSDGQPRVADFGLARRVDRQQAVADNSIAGTPGYMAPEQLTPGQVLGPAADVWGLGATLYEALTGHVPFERMDMETPETARRRGIVRNPRRYRPRLPRDLEAICLKCLQEDPAQRYASARALADDLGRYLEGRQVMVRPLGLARRTLRWARRERRLAAISVVAVAVLAGGLVATNHQRWLAEDSATSAQEHLWTQRHETAWRLLEEGRDYQALPLLAQNLGEQEASGASGSAAAERLRLGLIQSQAPALLSVVDAGAPIHALALSDDGRHVALGLGESRVALYPATAGEPLWQVSLGPAAAADGDHQLRHLRFTPDRQWLLVTDHAPLVHGLPGAATYRLAVADGHRTEIPDLPGLRDASYQAWSDDGRMVLLSDRSSWVQLFEADGWRATGPARRLDIAWHHDWIVAPGAAFIAMLDGAEGLRILEPDTLATRHHVAAGPAADRFGAWAVSPDARHVALGRLSGEVLLLDAVSGSLRVLLPGLARPAWLSFSADGSHLAASFGSGDFLILDVPGGRVRARARHEDSLWGHQFECGRAGPDPQPTCLALLMQFDRIRLWSTSDGDATGVGDVARVYQVSPEITHPSYLPRFASMLNRARGLLATGGQDGSLRLWRLPDSPFLPWPAPTRQEVPLAFDGQHVVGVDGDRLQVFDPRSGRPLSPPMRVPGTVGFAALAGDGRSLVASSGPELHVFDWGSGRLRYPPLQLGGSPSHLSLADDGSMLVAAWLDPAASDRTAALQAFSISDGRALGPAAQASFARMRAIDGGRVMVTAADATRVFDAASLQRPLHAFAAPPDTQVVVDAHAVGGDTVVQYLESPPALQSSLRWWSLRDGRPLAGLAITARVCDIVPRGRDGRLAVIASPGFTAFTDVSLLLDADGTTQPVSGPRGARLAHAQAFSPDGATLAQAVSRGVLLVNADDGRPLGPVLKHWLPEPDEVSQLAFSPDGGELLARTVLGRWLHWPLVPDARPQGLVAAEGQLLSPAQGSGFRLPGPAMQEMLLGRSAQPRHRAVAMSFSASSCLPTDAAVPARARQLPAHVLDLDAVYTAPLHFPVDGGPSDTTGTVPGRRCWIPMGHQRLLGVDYDLRGVLALQPADGRAAPAGMRSLADTGRLPVPPGRYAGGHVLSSLGPLRQAHDEPVGEFIFHYRDGGAARVAMRSAPSPTFVLGADYVLPPGLRTALATPQADALFAEHLRNPHPGRDVVAVGLAASPSLPAAAVLSVFAVTMEPSSR